MKLIYAKKKFLRSPQRRAGLNRFVLCGGLVLSGAGGNAYAGDLILPPGKDLVVSGDHRHDHITFNRDSLTIKSTASLGSQGEPASRFKSGHIIIEGGASMMGKNMFENDTTGQVGVASTTSAKLAYAGLHDHAKVDFDNVSLTGFDHGPETIEGLKLYDSSQATLTARTRIHTTTEETDGLQLFDDSRLSAVGSSIIGYTDGVLVRDSSSISLTNTSVTGGSSGVKVGTAGDVVIAGGTVTGTGDAPYIPLAGSHALGGLMVGSSSTDHALTGPHVMVSDGAVIRGMGTGYAGIVSASEGLATSRIDVGHSTVGGRQYGVRFTSNHVKAGEGLNAFTASQTAIMSDKGAAIRVDDDVRVKLDLNEGVTLQSGNGVALDAGKGSDVQLSVKGSHLGGDILNDGGKVNVHLEDGAGWQGAMKGVSSLNIDKGTTWVATTSSSLEAINNNGLMVLSGDGAQRNTVAVAGYTSNGGEVHFNSILGDDRSPTDKLLITGNSSGRSTVTVSNLGGHGSETINGIELIHTSGMAQAEFTQKGRIAAGLYDYTLQHNADKSSWFLTSAARTSKSTPFKHDIQVYRPETGSYLANLDAARTMFVTRLRDRAGEMRLLDPVSGEEIETSLWLRQTGNHRRFSDSSGQIKTQSNTYVVQLGGDLVQWSTNGRDRWRLGVMGGYGNSHSHSHGQFNDYASRGDVDGYSTGIYGTWYADDVDKTGAYVDGWATYGWFNNHVKGSEVAAERYKSQGITASLESGYTLRIGGSATTTGYYIEPQAQLVWMGVHGNDMSEGNGTWVQTQGRTNLQSRLGIKAFMKGHSHLDDGKGRTFQPFIEANWIHNTQSPGIAMDKESDRQAGASNLGEVKLGLEGRLSKGIQVWASTGQQLGGKGYADTTATLGVRYSF